jgi:hypothetical protein
MAWLMMKSSLALAQTTTGSVLSYVGRTTTTPARRQLANGAGACTNVTGTDCWHHVLVCVCIYSSTYTCTYICREG